MNTNKFVRIIVALVTVIASPHYAVGGTTWDGGGGNDDFSTGANWNDNSTPPTGTTVDLFFAGSTRLTPNNDYGNFDDFRSIFFNSGAGSFVISGNSIDFFDGKIENNSANDQSLNIANFSFNNGSQEVNPVSGNLTLGGGGSIFSNGQQMDVFGANGHTLTIGKTMTGNGGITIKQNSIVNITAAQTYTGDTFIDAGSFRINEGGSLGSTTVRLGLTSGSAAASFFINDADGGTTEDASIVVRNGSAGAKTIGGLNTSGDNTISSAISLDDNVSLSAESGGRIVFSGAITDGAGAGTFGAAVNAAGTVQLAGASANSGSTWTVQAGTLELNKTAGTDAIAGATVVQNGGTLRNVTNNQINNANSVTINSGGTWDLNGRSETVNSVANSGILSIGAGQLITTNSGGSWSGTVSASSGGSLVFVGGVTGLSAANTGLASGSEIYVVGGILGLNNNSAAGSATIFLGETNGSATARLDSSTANVSIGNNITVRSGSGGIKTIDNATTGGSRQITFNGNISLADTLFVDASAGETTVFDGVISNSSGIVKRGFGTMTIGDASTFGGVMAIDEGSLRIASGGDLTAASNITIGSSIFNAGAGAADLTLASGASGIDRSVVVASGAGSRLLASEGNNTVSGTITQSANLTVSNTTGTLNLSAVTMNTSGNNDLAVAGAGNVSIGGTITASSGASEINKSGAGTLSISGDNNSQSYMLNIGGGKVVLDNANALGTGFSDKVNFTANSTLNAAANIGPASLGLRVGSGVTGTIEVNNGNNLTAATLGSVSGTGTFNKTGAGTLTLAGTSTVANANNVNQGTLFVSSGAALAGTTTVSSGGTLAGSGSVGATTIASGGTINPGDSPGTLTLTNGLTFSSGGNYNWQIFNADDGLAPGLTNTWDLIAVTGGDWDISGLSSVNQFNINLWSLSGISPDVNGDAINFNNALDSSWEILTYTSLVGTFNSDLFVINSSAFNGTSGFSNDLNGGTFSLEADATSLYLLFTASGGPGPEPIPEPGTWAAAALLAGAAGYVRWRRRRIQKSDA